jgi:hypothetical protein
MVTAVLNLLTSDKERKRMIHFLNFAAPKIERCTDVPTSSPNTRRDVPAKAESRWMGSSPEA